MKEKRVVTYIKEGKEITKVFNFLSKREILNTLFEKPFYQTDNYEFYKIKSDIDYLSIKNMNFKKDARFILPDNTILVIENCTFKSGRIDLTGGNIDLLHPKLNPCFYTNRIFVSDVNNLNIEIGSDNRSFITVTGTANNFSMTATNRIENIAITGKTAQLKNIKDIKSLKLINEKTTLKNCIFSIDLDNDMEKIQTETLDIEDSNLFYLNYQNRRLLSSKNINLKNAIISSENNVNIDCEKIIMDNQSTIESKHNIKLLIDTYTIVNDESKIKVNLQSKDTLNKRKELISVLKGLKNYLSPEEEIVKKTIKTRKLKK